MDQSEAPRRHSRPLNLIKSGSNWNPSESETGDQQIHHVFNDIQINLVPDWPPSAPRDAPDFQNGPKKEPFRAPGSQIGAPTSSKCTKEERLTCQGSSILL